LDINSIRAKIAATKDEESFGLYDAYMAHAVDTLKAGSAGLSCIQGNYFPELVVWLCDNYDNIDKTKEVDLVQGFFRKNMDIMHDTYPVSAKYVLQKLGQSIQLYSRCQDINVLTAEAKSGLDLLIEDYKDLDKQLHKSYISSVFN